MKVKTCGIIGSAAIVLLLAVIALGVWIGNENSLYRYEDTIEASEFTEEELLEMLDTEDTVLCYTPDADSYESLEGDLYYVNNTLIVYLMPGATIEEKQTVIDSLDGTLVGLDTISNCLQIEVGAQSKEDLEALCAQAMELEPVAYASYDIALPIGDNYTPNDPFKKMGKCDWDGNFEDNNWAWEAIDAEKAWEFSSCFSDISIGLVDSGFWPEHEDFDGLHMVSHSFSQDSSNYLDEDKNVGIHATAVASVIAARADNKTGLAGMVQNISNLRFVPFLPQGTTVNSLDDLSYTFISRITFCISKLLTEKNDLSPAKVINISQGYHGEMGDFSYDTINHLAAQLSSYILLTLYNGRLEDPNFDFLIVQSAGNGYQNQMKVPIKTELNGLFSTVSESNCQIPTGKFSEYSQSDILDRIIVVSSITHDGNQIVVDPGASYGETVDILAPGRDVYVSIIDQKFLTLNQTWITNSAGDRYTDISEQRDSWYAPVWSDYRAMDGTSFSTPFVTGTAALVWSANPELTAPQVKEILLKSSELTLSAPDYYDMFVDENGELYSYPVLNAGDAVEMAVRTETVDLEPACSVKVLDSVTKEPVEGAEVYLITELPYVLGEDPNTMFTDATGSCFFTNLDISGPIPAVVTAAGYEDYDNWVYAFNKYDYSTDAPYYVQTRTEWPENTIYLTPASPSQSPSSDSDTDWGKVLDSLIAKYGVIPTGSEKYTGTEYGGGETLVPAERITGLLGADLYDYDSDGKKELLTIRAEPTQDYETGKNSNYQQITFYIAVYDEPTEDSPQPVDEISFPMGGIPDTLYHSSVQFMRGTSTKGTFLYLDHFFNFNSQAFGTIQLTYDGNLHVSGGVGCFELAQLVYCNTGATDSPLEDILNQHRDETIWEDISLYDWEGESPDIPDSYLEQYCEKWQNGLLDIDLTDSFFRTLYTKYAFPDGYKVSYEEYLAYIGECCTRRPAESCTMTDNGVLTELCGILSPCLSNSDIQLTCYDSIGLLERDGSLPDESHSSEASETSESSESSASSELSESSSSTASSSVQPETSGCASTSDLFEVFTQSFLAQDTQAIASLYGLETEEKRKELEQLWNDRIGEVDIGGTGISGFRLGEGDSTMLSQEEAANLCDDYSITPEAACRMVVRASPDYSAYDIWPDWLTDGIELYLVQYQGSWYLLP